MTWASADAGAINFVIDGIDGWRLPDTNPTLLHSTLRQTGSITTVRPLTAQLFLLLPVVRWHT